MNIKFDDLASYVHTVRHQSLSRAAVALGLTQPAVTRRIQNLEESLGTQLLDRDTKPPRPNALGRLVFEQCERILREVDALRALVERDSVPHGQLRLGITQTVAETGIDRLIDDYRALYPDLKVHLLTRWSGELLRLLENGEIDAAAVTFPAGKVFPPAIEAHRLTRVDMHVVVARGSWPSRAEPYRLRDLQRCRWIVNPDGCGFRARLRHALGDLGLPFEVAMDAFGTELQLRMVGEGLGLGLASRAQIERSRHREAVELLPLADFDPSMEMWLIQRVQAGLLTEPIARFGDAAVAAYDTPFSFS